MTNENAITVVLSGALWLLGQRTSLYLDHESRKIVSPEASTLPDFVDQSTLQVVGLCSSIAVHADIWRDGDLCCQSRRRHLLQPDHSLRDGRQVEPFLATAAPDVLWKRASL